MLLSYLYDARQAIPLVQVSFFLMVLGFNFQKPKSFKLSLDWNFNTLNEQLNRQEKDYHRSHPAKCFLTAFEKISTRTINKKINISLAGITW